MFAFVDTTHKGLVTHMKEPNDKLIGDVYVYSVILQLFNRFKGKYL